MTTPPDYDDVAISVGGVVEFDDLIPKRSQMVAPIPGLVVEKTVEAPEAEPRSFRRRGLVPSVSRKQRRIQSGKRPDRGAGKRRK